MVKATKLYPHRCSLLRTSLMPDKVAPKEGADGRAGAVRVHFAVEEEKVEVARTRTARRFYRYSNPWNLRREDSSLLATDGGNEDDQRDENDPALSLFVYFTTLEQDTKKEIDFDYMQELISNGASVNTASSVTGQHLLHIVAACWDVAVASFLVSHGADIHCTDTSGRTPLHIAASTDHTAMIEYLLGQGADIDSCTLTEKQTAIHHAARSDSLQALQMLIEHGGDYEVRDYKGRTPLHLAAELDRTEAAEYLLSLDKPAECQVSDNLGNTVLVSMIRTMPKVALIAMDQLHRVAPADRKQYFLLSHLEPEPGDRTTQGVKTAFEITVEEEEYCILTHPVMKELMTKKWQSFVRVHFYFDLLLYVIFLLTWTLLYAYPSVQEKYQYIFPRDVWRIVVEVIAMGTYIYQIVDEVIEFVRSKRKHQNYTRMRTQALQDDLANIDVSLPEERKYLEHEVLKVRRSPPNYFRSPWNIIDIVTFVIMLVIIILHIVDVITHSEQLALWTARVSCIALVLIWVRLLKYGRGFKIIGPLIAIISHLIGDICKYFAIKLVFYIPFVICFWLLFGGPQAEGQEDAEDLTQFYRVMMVLFRMTLVDDYPYSTLREIDELMTSLLVTTYLLFTAVIGLNLFIALLSDTFQRVYDNAQANAEMQQARIILTMEEKAWRWWRERYLRHIHINCNPSSCYYDDDDTAEDDTSPKLQKITHQIHSIVSELQDERKEGGGTPRVMEELTNRMEQQEKEMAQVSQHLAEVKNILLALHGGKCPENASDSTNQKFHSSHLPTQSQTESCQPQQEAKILPHQPKLIPLQTTRQVSTSHASSLSPSLPPLAPHTTSPSPTPHSNLHLPTLHTFATQYIGSGREHRRVRRKSMWEEEAERWERRVQRKASGIKQD